MSDSTTPVIVAVTQLNGLPPGCEEPIDLLDAVAAQALADVPALVASINLVGAVKTGTKRYGNAPGILAARRGLGRVGTVQTDFGGQTAQLLIAHAAAAIRDGSAEAVLLGGCEMGSLLRRKLGHIPNDGEHDQPDLTLGDDVRTWMYHPHEASLGLTEPLQLYPLLETAIAWSKGETIEQHMRGTARLWADFSEVASRNPYAADRQVHSADALLSAGPDNRYVGYPYTKQMNSNQFVDQAAAFVLCSVAAAKRAGIPRDRWVFPWAAAQAQSPFVSERKFLHLSPQLARAGRAVAAMTGRPAADATLVDLYACFPSAVQMQAAALEIPAGRPLTLTGGMRFAGGPWNSYGLHMLANVVGALREQPDEYALACTNGGFATRFVLGAYAGRPHPQGFQTAPAPFTAEAGDKRPLDAAPSGEAAIEAFSVVHDKTNTPTLGIVTCRTPGEARAWALFQDAASLDQLLAMQSPGRRVRFANGQAVLV